MAKKPEPYGKAWTRYLIEALREDFGHEYRSCEGCGRPTHKMYICRWCGFNN